MRSSKHSTARSSGSAATVRTPRAPHLLPCHGTRKRRPTSVRRRNRLRLLTQSAHRHAARPGLALRTSGRTPDHIHLVVVPSGLGALARTLGGRHPSSAPHVSAHRRSCGRVWPGRGSSRRATMSLWRSWNRRGGAAFALTRPGRRSGQRPTRPKASARQRCSLVLSRRLPCRLLHDRPRLTTALPRRPPGLPLPVLPACVGLSSRHDFSRTPPGDSWLPGNVMACWCCCGTPESPPNSLR